MTKWREKERAMAPHSHRLHQGGITSRDWFSDKLWAKICWALIQVRQNYETKNLYAHVGQRQHYIFIEQFSFIYLFMAFSISMVTSTERAMVIG
jgi:hypothetical protein